MLQRIGEWKSEITQKAPDCKDLTHLSKEMGWSRTKMYRFLNDHPETAKSVTELLGRNYITPKGNRLAKAKGKDKTLLSTTKKRNLGSKKKDKGEMGQLTKNGKILEYKVVQIRVPVKPDNFKGGFLTPQERYEQGAKICEMIEMGVTIQNACEAIGMDSSNFYRWTNPMSASYIEELALRLNDAKHVYNTRYKEELLVLARDSMRLLAQDRTVTNTVKIGRADSSGKVIPHTIKTDTKTIAPNPSIVTTIMKTLHDDFKEDAGSKKEQDPYNLRHLSDEALEQQMEEIQRKLASS